MKIITTMLAVVCAAILWDYTFVWWMGDGLEGLGGRAAGRRRGVRRVGAQVL